MPAYKRRLAYSVTVRILALYKVLSLKYCILTLKWARNPIEIKSFIHGNSTILLVFTQALKGFLKAQQWPGTKCTHYFLYINKSTIYKLSKYLNNYIICLKTH